MHTTVPTPSLFYLFFIKERMQDDLIKKPYVLEDGNEGGRKANPTSISIFDFYGIKAL